MDILAFPIELLIKIINHCDLQTRGRLCAVCRRLEEFVNTDNVWKCTWERLHDGSLYNDTPDETSSLCYKSMCQQYVAIQRQIASAIQQEPYLIGPVAGNDKLDILALDVGSKTTWLKRTREWSICYQHIRTPNQTPATSIATVTSQIKPQHQQADISQQLSHLPEQRPPDNLQQNEGKSYEGKPTTRVYPERFGRESIGQKDVHRNSPVKEEDMKDGWLDGEIFPKGLVLCTCLLCEPRLRKTDDKFLPMETLVQPTPCLHSDSNSPGGSFTDGTAPRQTMVDGAHETTTDSWTATSTRNLMRKDEYSTCTVTAGDGFVLSGDDITVVVRRLVELTGIRVNYWRAVCQLCEPTGWSSPHLLRFVQTIFENLGVSRLCLVPKPVCIAMALGVDTCLVVDSGAHHTQVGAVVNQRLVLTSAYVRSIAGAHLSQCLAQSLQVKGVTPKVCPCLLDGRDIKEKCHLSHHAGGHQDNAPHHLSIRSLSHPNGWCKVTLTEELRLAAEVMYLTLNLPEMIQKALSPMTFELQKQLVANILLSGGNCRLNGLSSRLQLDLQMLMPHLAPWIWVRSRSCIMTHDAVEGVSYIGLQDCGAVKDDVPSAKVYITRDDYIMYGAEWCLDNLQRYWRVHPTDL